MKTPESFPLLNSSYILEHHMLCDAIRQVKEAIFSADDTGIVQVVGCTGAGKTKLIEILTAEINRSYAEKLKLDRAIIPIASFEVSLLSNRGFNWTYFYQECLLALRHPEPVSADAAAARDKITNAYSSRQTIAMLIDEAHHIMEGCKGDKQAIKRQAEVLKSLCKKMVGKIILIGHYDLIPLIRTNGQTSRRNRIIHLGRYQNTKAGRATFREILRSIDETCAKWLEVKLEDHEEMLFMGSVGLVGVLRTWLVRALENARLEDERDAITLDSLHATRRSILDLRPILEEAQTGEDALLETEEDKDVFEKMMAEDANPDRVIKREQSKPPNPASKRCVSPGRRKAKRDVVGGN